ncbi:zinc ribbon domain-containing protein [Cohnella sp. AR92]|uniref:zinc ribbon domain-containing protein n=1 Tax=Cohnella sp. AR92 TaxID=648716 RepID=UPI0013152420|nr:hypothetical protein [Cohnella sp. AR92]
MPQAAPAVPQAAATVERQAATAESQTAAAAEPLVHASPIRSRRLSRKWILIASAALLVILLLAGGYKFEQYRLSEGRVLDKLEKALDKKDGAALASLLTSENAQLKLDADKTRGFLAYLDAYPSAAHELMSELRKQSFRLDNDDDDYSNDEAVIRLEKSKKYVLFQEYKLVVEPVFIRLGSNYKDVSLFIDGQEVFKTTRENEHKEFGPYLPGLYDLEAKMATGFVDLSAKQEAEIWYGNKQYEASLDLQAERVEVLTGLEQSGLQGKLLINGQDTGLNPFETTSFGPVTTDGSMNLSVEAEFPWGTIRSNEMAIASTSVELNLADSEDLQKALIERVAQYETEWLDGLTSKDSSKLTTGTAKLRAELQSSIGYMGQSDYIAMWKYTGAQYDLDSFRLQKSEDGQWMASLTLIARFLSGQYRVGDLPPQELYEDGQGQDVVLVYDETAKAWLVDSIQTFYDGFEMSDRIKDVPEQNPKLFKSTAGASSASVDWNSSEVGAFLLQYLSSSVEAINSRDFSLVSGMIDEAGPSYKESSSYIDYLKGKGITEQLLSANVDQVQTLDDGSYQASTSETYDIYYQDGSVKTKSFKAVYKIVLMDGVLRVNQLIETKEQS